MRAAYWLSFTLLLATPAHAKKSKAALPDVHPVEVNSVDVFQVLQILRRADQSYAHDPDLAAARTGLRRSHMARGSWDMAARYLDDDVADNALMAAMRTGDTAPLQMALITKTRDPRLWTALGRFQDRDGAHAQARESYRAAAQAGARPGLASNNIGQSFLLEGRANMALRAFEAAVQQDPHDVRFDNNRRRALLALDRLPEAIAELNADRAAGFLTQAGRQALMSEEPRLAGELLAAAARLSPRHDPAIAALAERAARDQIDNQ